MVGGAWRLAGGLCCGLRGMAYVDRQFWYRIWLRVQGESGARTAAF